MRAWILGAGFSVRLGGPTLNQLLSRNSYKGLRARYPETWLSEPAGAVCVDILRKGMRRGFWENAEDYIAALNSNDPVHESNVADLCGGRFTPACAAFKKEVTASDLSSSLYCQAIALVAAQCMDFVSRSADDLESWIPYDRWVRGLPSEDVLISFNYDEVVEEAFRRNDKMIDVPNPRTREDFSINFHREQTLLKLHGGVNVRDTILDPPETNSIGNLCRNPAMIAVPGTSKVDASESRFREIWEAASSALQEADEVSIVGYSCPRSDEVAKAMLLDSLQKNRGKPTVEIVLGPGGSIDARRLSCLLGQVGLTVIDTGLWAQDYLSVHGLGEGWQTLDGRV